VEIAHLAQAFWEGMNMGKGNNRTKKEVKKPKKDKKK